MYFAYVYPNSRDKHWLTPIYKTIRDVEGYLQRHPNIVEDVREVVVMKGSGRRSTPTIHGYYDWTNSKLRLDKSKPAWVHNAFYGLGG